MQSYLLWTLSADAGQKLPQQHTLSIVQDHHYTCFLPERFVLEDNLSFRYLDWENPKDSGQKVTALETEQKWGTYCTSMAKHGDMDKI